MCASVVVLSLLLISIATGNDENQEVRAKIRFYKNSIESFTELNLDEAENILSAGSWYDPSKTTVMFTHGFGGYPKGPAVTAVVTAYLKAREYNVALLNWESQASMALPGVLNSYMNWAVPNAIQLGTDFAETLLKLSTHGLDLNNTHFIGHSLGAHIFGIAGNRLMEKGVQLPWITGLDPATGFDMKPAFMKLNPSSAIFTDVIHTDPHKYGSKKELGLVNYWPNFRAFGTVLQPGCPSGNHPRFSVEDFCSHNRSWQLLIDALENPGSILASHAKNFRAWKKFSQEQREQNIMKVGDYNPDALPGNYFFTTAERSPFGLGKDGL